MLFKNRFGALGFVILTVVGAASLVGTEENGGLIEQTRQGIEQQKQDFEAEVSAINAPENVQTPQQVLQPAGPAPARTSPGNVELAEGEHLIDPAEGYDPTPADEFDPESLSDPEEVVIILNNRPISR